MSEVFRYRAIENGTLSNPYRFVKKGQVVELPAPLAKPSKWLLPIEEATAKLDRPLPVTPYLTQKGRNVQHRVSNYVPPAPASKGYGQQMEYLRKAEAVQDRKADPSTLKTDSSKITPPTPSASAVGERDDGRGRR